MRLIGTVLRAGVALVALALGVACADAQGAGGLAPGANDVRKLNGGPTTSCSARNALATKQCTTTCPAGQTADCADSDDSSDPTCQCSGG